MIYIYDLSCVDLCSSNQFKTFEIYIVIVLVHLFVYFDNFTDQYFAVKSNQKCFFTIHTNENQIGLVLYKVYAVNALLPLKGLALSSFWYWQILFISSSLFVDDMTS